LRNLVNMSVSPAVIKKTQDMLGKFIKKPPLTEKLLTKPPFRFLHDVISAVIREHGILQGIFTDAESKSENVKGQSINCI
jgi:TRAF3-interacting protein 1